MEKDAIKKRIKELNGVFKRLPPEKMIILRNTIETVAFMDIQLKELEEAIGSGAANTPDKQLYSTMAKTRDVLLKKLMAELPPTDEDDDFDRF